MDRRKGEVTYKDQVIGILEETPIGGTNFTYSDQWDKNPIACTLTKKYIEWKDGLHPFFQNLCPEGWLREKQSKVGRLDSQDDLGFILRFGKDCIGAVGIMPVYETEIDLEQNGAIVASIKSNKTISGVQEKLLVYKGLDKFYPSQNNDPATYIAKFDSNSYPDLVRNEYKCLRLAQAVIGKDKVTDFSSNILEDRATLIVKRFDRDGNIKLKMEEFAQILNKSSREKYDSSYEAIGSRILQHSVSPEIDLLLYFKQIIFNIIIGNTDAHLKNFALLETKNGMRLSPAYDLVNTMLYYKQGHDTKLALALGEEKLQWSDINRKILSDFGKNIGLKDQAVKFAFKEIKNQIIKSKNILLPPSIEEPDSFNNIYKEIVDSACQRIFTE
jgi:serine/threonine-protein kinase HipA